MTMDVKSQNGKAATAGGAQNPGNQECAGCGKHITERYLLKALDMFWHEDCLKCGCCDCRLGEVGSTLYTKANLILCKRDYLRLFGNTGYCAACSKVIPAFEMVMRARNNVYHLECFACQQCNHSFSAQTRDRKDHFSGARPLQLERNIECTLNIQWCKQQLSYGSI
ncbi:hypothetical protein GE061_005007 [Apolygus lucorum]|uniref:LIM zinc-binding domain-containing protein n=1 Tax=Apolygus lucorum TaxID=248454 RepID=A0A8S9WWF6_APOLU|nr:hypothetical protein GE061_005007 [Apolygus lucorum]